jgi:peptide/nickel transport system substrate-binding protein
VPVGAAPRGVFASRERVWVTDEVSATLVTIDPRSFAPTRTPLGGRPHGIAEAEGRLWVSIQPTGRSHRGGVLRLLTEPSEVDTIDPARSYSGFVWRLLATTHDGLVGFAKFGGPEGNRLVPDLARTLVAPTHERKTYTFRLRDGIRFSTGRVVRPSDVRASFERMFRGRSAGAHFYEAIAGARRCRNRPAACDLSDGVVADDHSGTVTFRLTRPDPEFLYKLALPFAFVVPAGTPLRQRLVPGTGPYRFASYTPGRRVRLTRNPHFRLWSRAAQPEGIVGEIVAAIGGRPDSHLAAVASGRADGVGGFAPESVPALRARFPGQVHLTASGAVFAAVLNVHRPPFASRLAREAVAFALDRRRMVDASAAVTSLPPPARCCRQTPRHTARTAHSQFPLLRAAPASGSAPT